MIASKGLVSGAIAVTASIAAMGCGAQSAAFRHMSAVDHESAARVAQGDPAEAQEHLEAAKRLRDEEQVACYGLSDSDRLQGPFAHPNQITNIAVVRDRVLLPRGPFVPVGVAVDLRAEQGMTQQWLGRVVACHMSHIAVVGQDSQPSPLSVANTQVSVSSTSVGFRVKVTSHDRDIAQSVVNKGQELAESTYRQQGGGAVGMASIR